MGWKRTNRHTSIHKKATSMSLLAIPKELPIAQEQANSIHSPGNKNDKNVDELTHKALKCRRCYLWLGIFGFIGETDRAWLALSGPRSWARESEGKASMGIKKCATSLVWWEFKRYWLRWLGDAEERGLSCECEYPRNHLVVVPSSVD